MLFSLLICSVVSKELFRVALITVVIAVSSFVGCATPYPWPASPLYPELVPEESSNEKSLTREGALREIVGHYAHFDVVAYEDPPEKKRPMRTFVVSYGFTEFYLEEGQLFERDSFCHAKHRINYKSVRSEFKDAATQAIKPLPKKVELKQINNQWQIYRPPTPTLLGVIGDPNQPLPKTISPDHIVDADSDGYPGVTVDITIGGFIKGRLYIARREIFSNTLTLQADGRILGHVKDESEQRVLGASLSILKQESDPDQSPDIRMNPILLVPIRADQAKCQILMDNMDVWFPRPPTFF